MYVAAAFDARLIQSVSVYVLLIVESGRLMLFVNGVVISSVGTVVLVLFDVPDHTVVFLPQQLHSLFLTSNRVVRYMSGVVQQFSPSAH